MFLLQIVGRERNAGRRDASRDAPDSRRAPVSLVFGPGLLDAGEMMAPPHSGRQPLQLPGRYWGGTGCVVSTGEPQRHDVMTAPAPEGTLPVLSSGARVTSWVSILPSLNPRSEALITPKSLTVTKSTYMD